jgi:predicted metalloprotease with PDZ domain
MDLEIASAKKGTKSLDDVMKAMYWQCKTLKRGYTDAEFKAMAEKVSGISFTNFWSKYVTGTAEIEFQKYFGYAGIEVTAENATPNKPSSGAALTVNQGLFVSGVTRNSAAWEDGLNVNDQIVSIDGIGVVSAMRDVKLPNPALTLDIIPAVSNKQIGDKLTLKIIRDGLEKDITLTLKANPTVRLKTEVSANATPAQLAVRKRWLGVN